MIELLRQRLKELEDERRFAGRPYPPGIEPFPRTLVGQGFFPGGDGLWREELPASRLREPSRCPFPTGGIMFLGNDFGSLDGFQRLGLYENPPTWPFLRRRLFLAEISGVLGFYTNAYLGLRTDRDALDNPIECARFEEICAEYLDFQILCQEPRLIVVLGPRPSKLLDRLIPLKPSSVQLQFGDGGGREVAVLVVSHPYSDLGKSPEELAEDADRLRCGWATATRRD